jgi:formylglycine-generating enzyme required for sulfatase activity
MKTAQIITAAVLAAALATSNLWAEEQPTPKPVVAAKATKENPWENSLGMKFVPVPKTKVLFSIWDTRVEDFEQFCRDAGYDATCPSTEDVSGAMYSVDNKGVWGRHGANWKNPGFKQGPSHPVVGVSWLDAKAFCAWLTKKERKESKIGPSQEYRLPTDDEWSAAVGGGKYPWGDQWPPPAGAGNYAGSEAKDDTWPDWPTIEGYRDDYPRTSPVGSFRANQHGLFDMGGNVWQWCEDWYRTSMNNSEALKNAFNRRDQGGQSYRVLRGGSWQAGDCLAMSSSIRSHANPDYRYAFRGFRCVLVMQ